MSCLRALAVLVACALCGFDTTSSSTPTAPPLPARSSSHPIRFEQNAGQWDGRVRYVARGSGETVFLTDEGATFALRAPSDHRPRLRPGEKTRARTREPDRIVTLRLAGGRAVAPTADARLVTRSNYFSGSDPSAWRSGVGNFGRVTYASVLEGVDLVFHGEEGKLEYDLVLGPGVRADAIALEIGGADEVSSTPAGASTIRTSQGDLVHAAPRAYVLDEHGERQFVDAAYRLAEDGRLAFEVGSYDRSRALVIDPIVYAT